MGGCQNYGPFLGTLNIRCRIIIRTQKGTLILIPTHMIPAIQAHPQRRGSAGTARIMGLRK